MLVFFAALLPVVILFCGLAVDAAMLHLKALQMQSAADAAAFGAELEWERGTGNWSFQGMADAALNGFTNGSNGVTISIWQEASIGVYQGDFDVLQVTIIQNVKTFFWGSLSGGTTTVMARAGALMPPCVYLTAAAGFPGIYTMNVANASVYPACPLYANKTISIDDSSILKGYENTVAGPSGASFEGGTASPATRFDALPLLDPLAFITAPSFSSCTYTSYSLTAGTATLNPGTYCGTSSTRGMTISNATVTLNPGLYIITGGAHWTTSTINGTGVTLYFTQGNGASYGQFRFDNQTYVNLSAPATSSGGALATMLIFGDRNWVATSSQDFQCDSSYFTGDGIWYTTGTGMAISACGYFYGPNYSALVTDNLYANLSTVDLKSNFSNIPTGNPFRPTAVLVE